jgi:hypothetical protein
VGLEADVEVCHYRQLARCDNSFIASGAYSCWFNFESERQNFLDLRRTQVARDHAFRDLESCVSLSKAGRAQPKGR